MMSTSDPTPFAFSLVITPVLAVILLAGAAVAERRMEGTVVIRARIDAAGRVTGAVVKEGLSAGLTEEAVRALERWKFEPATRDGEPVEWEMDIQVSFELD